MRVIGRAKGGGLVSILCPTFCYGQWNGVHYYYGEVREADGSSHGGRGAQAGVAHQVCEWQGPLAQADPIEPMTGDAKDRNIPTAPPLPNPMFIERELLQAGLGGYVTETLVFIKSVASVRVVEDIFVEYEELATFGMSSKKRRARLLLLSPTPSTVGDRLIAIGQELPATQATYKKAVHIGTHPYTAPARSKCQFVNLTQGAVTRTYYVLTADI